MWNLIMVLSLRFGLMFAYKTKQNKKQDQNKAVNWKKQETSKKDKSIFL